ncbi:MAG: hypothetical protein LBT97_14245 [Planctomycetota bacterium]|jgi:hypothetical protein|nr:hypothetical protein [Planctomycetota bacterium]
MPFLTAYAHFIGGDWSDNAKRAVARIRDSFAGHSLKAVLYFAAQNYDLPLLAAEFKLAFPGVRTFGCTSAGEFTSGAILGDSVVAMGLGDDVIESVELVGASGVDAEPALADRLLAGLEGATGLRMRDLDFREYVGFMLLDGLANRNDEFVERVGELTDVIFAGGCAGDYHRFEKTLVFLDGAVYGNGAVLALMKPRVKFSVFKTQFIKLTDCTMVATAVDRERRVVLEFDGQPAATAYAAAMGVELSPELFKASGKKSSQIYAEAVLNLGRSGNIEDAFVKRFIEWPLAVMIGGEPFIRAATTLTDAGGLQMYMPPIAGVRYTATRSEDALAGMRAVLEEKRRELGTISGVITATCALLAVQLRTAGEEREYGGLFRDIPTVGLASYGEIYVGVVSQSAAMIVFGQ